ncbi:MAG: metal-dependent transcriptional regulator [Kiritimatiellae bacterium]|nr:metal-dependent transcriptional regulator [Kiritimatiellia bacterium]MCO5067123.1 metal-dependent transcriptional regulator [Kiritimatiellia bacterium]
MPTEVWKSYEDNLLTHSAAHYLMTIHELLKTQGYARVTDIAKRLNITRGSCSISLKPLKKRGLVVEDANKFLLLSDEGRRLAEIVERNDELLEIFLRDILGVDPEQAEVDACKIEHLLSIETSIKLCNFIECIRSGGPSAVAFLKSLRAHQNHCQRDASSCPHCQPACPFEEAAPKAPKPKKSR